MSRARPAAVSPEAMRIHAEEASSLLKALAHPDRLTVLCRLAEGEASVGQLNEQVDLSQSALSQHLAVLRRSGVVDTRREGQMIHYRLADAKVQRILEAIHSIYCERKR